MNTIHKGYKTVEHTGNNGQIRTEHEEWILRDPPILLHNFSEQEIREFLEVGDVEKLSLGDLVMQEGEIGDSACLVAKGLVSIWKNNIHITNLDRGAFIGEMFLFNPTKRIANVIAEEDTVVLRYSRRNTLDFFRKKPERLFKIFIINIVNLQQQKIATMDEKIIQLQQKLLQSEPGA